MINYKNSLRKTAATVIRDEIIRAETSYNSLSGHDPFFFAWSGALRWVLKELKCRRLGKIVIPKERMKVNVGKKF